MSGLPNIIVVGASARAAAFSALRAGMRPYAIDLFADSDLVDACPAVKIKRYPLDFEQALAEAPQAPWIYTGGLENYPDLIDRMSALRPLFGSGGDVLRKIRRPELLAACLAEADSNFAVPAIRSSLPPPDSEWQWLQKPRRSSGGLGIRRVNSAAGEARDARHYYQQFIPGLSQSAVYVALYGECELLGITSQLNGVPELPDEPFLYAGSATTPAKIADKPLIELGRLLTRSFGLRGLFNVDYVDDGRRIWPLEVNPRYSASMEVLEWLQGENFLAKHVAQFNPSFPSTRDCSISHRPQHVAKRIVYATSECVVTSALNELRKAWNHEARLPHLADIPRPGDRILRGQPVATVIAEGASEEEVWQVLRVRVREVEQTLSPP